MCSALFDYRLNARLHKVFATFEDHWKQRQIGKHLANSGYSKQASEDRSSIKVTYTESALLLSIDWTQQASNQVLEDLTRDMFSMQLLTQYFDIDEACQKSEKASGRVDDYTCKLLKLTSYASIDMKVHTPNKIEVRWQSCWHLLSSAQPTRAVHMLCCCYDILFVLNLAALTTPEVTKH